MARIFISRSTFVPRHEVEERIVWVTAEETGRNRIRTKQVALEQLAEKAGEQGGNAVIEVSLTVNPVPLMGFHVVGRGLAATMKKKHKKGRKAKRKYHGSK